MAALNVTRLPCCAPGAPAACSGMIVAYNGVPLCAGHTSDFANLTGPWKTAAGAAGWLAAMAPVIAARAAEPQLVGGRIEEPSGTPGKVRDPWIDWAAVRAGEAPRPAFARHYSDEARAEHAERRRRRRSSKGPKHTSAAIDETQSMADVDVAAVAKMVEKPEKNAKKRSGKIPWYVQRRWKKGRAAT